MRSPELEILVAKMDAELTHLDTLGNELMRQSIDLRYAYHDLAEKSAEVFRSARRLRATVTHAAIEEEISASAFDAEPTKPQES